ncbi:transketolase [Pseudovibrio exalbescens]|uniref:Transketolase n=1 Tax=Pseudovibrio exalbescens TaxID=197461 RepID=A0A1U7JKB1_9HYPH|nr:thiamine pyrophosphate-dependent enzyme [Pseudovibrio exalbescens]OKL45180.1 transketolase [Pseudovibrio exalbescens]
MKNQESEVVALGIRKRVFEHTIKNNGGYLSQACSAADSLAVLYEDVLNLGPSIAPEIPAPFGGVPAPDNPNSFTGAGYHGEFASHYDRFIISPAHYALVIYAALIEVGRMAPEGLKMFNKDGSSVEMIGAEHSPGMEVTNGSLAQGLSMASGIAFARKRRGDEGRVFVYMSDGEFEEGQTWECFANMAHHKINNVTCVVDYNAQQCDGAMSAVTEIGDLVGKLKAFGADAVLVDGHDHDALREAMNRRSETGPVVVIAKTSPFQGMDYLQKRFPRLHYVRFTSEDEKIELRDAIAEQLGVNVDEIE